MALKILLAAFFAAASMQPASKPATANAPTISRAAQAVATFVRCQVTRTDDSAIYGKNDNEIYYLADADFRIWNADARKWAFTDSTARWNEKYYTASARESGARGYDLTKKWVFDRNAGSMIYKVETTLARYNGGASGQDVIETSSFDFRCERTLDPNRPNGSNAF